MFTKRSFIGIMLFAGIVIGNAGCDFNYNSISKFDPAKKADFLYSCKFHDITFNCGTQKYTTKDNNLVEMYGDKPQPVEYYAKNKQRCEKKSVPAVCSNGESFNGINIGVWSLNKANNPNVIGGCRTIYNSNSYRIIWYFENENNSLNDLIQTCEDNGDEFLDYYE